MEIAKEIEVFLPTFFTAYTEGGQEQLNYLFETDNLATSLNKSMIFKEVKHTKIYVLDQSWLVFATVNLMDPTTNSPVETTYQLEITHDLNKQLVVSGFNNYEGLQIIN